MTAADAAARAVAAEAKVSRLAVERMHAQDALLLELDSIAQRAAAAVLALRGASEPHLIARVAGTVSDIADSTALEAAALAEAAARHDARTLHRVASDLIQHSHPDIQF